MTEPSLAVNLCGIPLRTPIILASGDGYHVSNEITLTALEPHFRVDNNVISSLPTLKYLNVDKEGTPLMASIFETSLEDCIATAIRLEAEGIELIELNLPRSPDQFRAAVIGVKEALTTSKLIVKLSPDVTNIDDYVRLAVECGADAISAISPMQALEIDPISERPLRKKSALGQSGASIRCIAQRKVLDILLLMKDFPELTVPVIGAGGIESGMDGVRFLLLGATCIQVEFTPQTKIESFYQGLLYEITEFMKQKGYSTLDAFRGHALAVIAENLER